MAHPIYKTHDLTVLFDARKTGNMSALKEALDNIETWFNPGVVVILTTTDDTTNVDYPTLTFSGPQEFSDWRSNFERTPDSRPLIEWFAEKYKDRQWLVANN